MKSLLLSLLMMPALIVPVTAQTNDSNDYLSDMEKKFPTSYLNWQKSLPPVNFGDWLSKFQGVVSPLKDITINGVPYKFGTTCIPHMCGDNIAGVLFTKTEDRISAIVEMHSDSGVTTNMAIGSPDQNELFCMENLLDDPQLNSCE